MIPTHIEKIHQAALQISKEFRSCELRLVEILSEVDAKEVFLHLGFPSLFRYAVDALGLTESIAYALIQVARTAQKVPELKQELEQGLSVFKAKKICSVLEAGRPVENQEWILKAKTLTSQKLESEVAKVKSPDVKTITLKLPEAVFLELQRSQELVSQSESKAASLEETLGAILKFYIKHRDPIEKAKCNIDRKKADPVRDPAKTEQEVQERVLRPAARRTPIPAREKHEAILKDQAQCSYIGTDGTRCPERRFLNFHHIRAVQDGGSDVAENLKVLCASHHRLLHWQEARLEPVNQDSNEFSVGLGI